MTVRWTDGSKRKLMDKIQSKAAHVAIQLPYKIYVDFKHETLHQYTNNSICNND